MARGCQPKRGLETKLTHEGSLHASIKAKEVIGDILWSDWWFYAIDHKYMSQYPVGSPDAGAKFSCFTFHDWNFNRQWKKHKPWGNKEIANSSRLNWCRKSPGKKVTRQVLKERPFSLYISTRQCQTTQTPIVTHQVQKREMLNLAFTLLLLS